METVKKFCEEINKPSRTALEDTIMEQKEEISELYNLIDALDYNLKMAKQVLNDNMHNYFSLEGQYLEYFRDDGLRRDSIVGDYIFQSINEIKETENRLRNKEGES